MLLLKPIGIFGSPKALEELKKQMLEHEVWVDEGGAINTQPPPPETSVGIKEIGRHEDTGEVTLKISPIYGDDVKYEIGDLTLKVKSVYGLRLWENEDLMPRPDDTFQERLFCVRWSETYTDRKGKEQSRRHFSSVTEADLERERKAFSLTTKRFEEWQEKAFIPSKKIDHGNETTRLFRERGWTHWHHLYTPRQLSIAVYFKKHSIAFMVTSLFTVLLLV